jgi:hypothetical protein
MNSFCIEARNITAGDHALKLHHDLIDTKFVGQQHHPLRVVLGKIADHRGKT